MTFAEAILRIGCALAAWLVVYAHALLVIVIPMTRCTSTGSDPWKASLVLAVPMGICLFLLPLGTAWRRVFRWFAVPVAVLAPLAICVVVPFLWGVTIQGAHPCQVLAGEPLASPSASWHRIWAPVQLLLLLGLSVQALRHWWPARVVPRKRMGADA